MIANLYRFGAGGLACIVLALAAASCCTAGISTPYSMITRANNIIVWQEFDPWLMITQDVTGGRICYFYDHTHRTHVNLKTPHPGDWMPLGSAIKWLLFVEQYNGRGRLMTHQVDYHQDFIAWPSEQGQLGCAMVGNVCYFGQYRDTKVGDHYPVDIYKIDVGSGLCDPICISSSEKSQFAHDGTLLVYRANFGGGDVRIYGCYLSSGMEFEIAARNGIEPSVCGPLVAWAEYNGSGYNIVAKNINTGEIRTVAYTTASPPCPEAGRGAIYWRDARNAATGVDIYGYDWQTGQEFVVTNASGDQNRLRVCDDVVTWVTGSPGFEVLWGARYEPPIRIDDLHITRIADDSVTLAWTVPVSSDNSVIGYEIRMRTDGPVTENNWASSTSIAGLPSPGLPGQSENFTVSQFQGGHYYFALKAILHNGQKSAISDSICAYISGGGDPFAASDGASTTYTGTITALIAGGFYCQSAAGERAVLVRMKDAHEAQIGERVAVTGVLGSDAQCFGPVLRDAYATALETSHPIDPVAMSGCAIGGRDARFGPPDGSGAANMWALVRVWGEVSHLTSGTHGCSFRLSDGSIPDGYVEVISNLPAPPGLVNSNYASATGIARLTRDMRRQVEITTAGSIVIYDPN